jgi:hypothetical protein
MWNLGGREREDAEEVEAGGQRRHRIQKEESTGRLGRFSSLLLAMLLVLVSLPPASPLGSWSRLVTLQGKASGGWTLDVEGTFDPGVNLVAQFDATEFYGSSQQVDTPSTAISSASLLSVTVPQVLPATSSSPSSSSPPLLLLLIRLVPHLSGSSHLPICEKLTCPKPTIRSTVVLRGGALKGKDCRGQHRHTTRWARGHGRGGAIHRWLDIEGDVDWDSPGGYIRGHQWLRV